MHYRDAPTRGAQLDEPSEQAEDSSRADNRNNPWPDRKEKTLLIHLAALLAFLSLGLLFAQDDSSKKTAAPSIYDFTVKRIDGSDCSLAEYKGHPLLIVNVASK